jgi:hypothetical protein
MSKDDGNVVVSARVNLLGTVRGVKTMQEIISGEPAQAGEQLPAVETTDLPASR